MASVVFVNHLPEGSASSYRQAGFARCLRRRGFDTTLVCRGSNAGRESGGSAPRSGQGAGRDFDRKVYWAEPFPYDLLSNLRVLSGALEGADIVHVNRANPYTATLLAAARRSRRAPLVVDLEDWDGYGGYSSYIRSYGPKGWVLTGFERTFPPKADAVVVVSKLLRSYVLSLGVPQEKVFVVHNGFDDDLFRPEVDGSGVREEYGLSDDPVVMYSSTFWKFERALHETALSSFELVLKEVPEARLLMTGREVLDIGTVLREGRVGSRVVRPGFVPRSAVPELMASADVAIHVISGHPFHAASSPMIIPEYMAMAKPVVAPRIGEIPEMLGDGAGILVDDVEPEPIARETVRLLTDRRLRKRVGGAARLRARERYSYEAGTADLMRAYERALA